jgi:hypothetical protein
MSTVQLLLYSVEKFYLVFSNNNTGKYESSSLLDLELMWSTLIRISSMIQQTPTELSKRTHINIKKRVHFRIYCLGNSIVANPGRSDLQLIQFYGSTSISGGEKMLNTMITYL